MSPVFFLFVNACGLIKNMYIFGLYSQFLARVPGTLGTS